MRDLQSCEEKVTSNQKEEKDYKYLFWDYGEVCRWESDQRATTLSRW